MNIEKSIYQLYTSEQLSARENRVNSINASAKIIITAVYIVCVMSFGRFDMISLLPYCIYPVVMILFAKLPIKFIIGRTAAAIPFCLFAGVSNLFFDNATVNIMGAEIYAGIISYCTILIKTVLSVVAILILTGTTGIYKIMVQLECFHVPDILVRLIEMMYRYCGALAGEVRNMFLAYKLRGGNKKGVNIKHMGSFIGQLFIRSMDRAERIYNAMKLRGYCRSYTLKEERTSVNEIFMTMFISGMLIFARCLL